MPIDDPAFWETILDFLKTVGLPGALIWAIGASVLFWLERRERIKAAEAANAATVKAAADASGFLREMLQSTFTLADAVKELAASSGKAQATLESVSTAVTLLADRIGPRRR